MFGLKAARLLRMDWKSPSLLARELYDMFTSPEPVQVKSPVSIVVGPGQTALTVSRANPEPEPSQIQAPPSVRNVSLSQPEPVTRRSIQESLDAGKNTPAVNLDVAARGTQNQVASDFAPRTYNSQSNYEPTPASAGSRPPPPTPELPSPGGFQPLAPSFPPTQAPSERRPTWSPRPSDSTQSFSDSGNPEPRGPLVLPSASGFKRGIPVPTPIFTPSDNPRSAPSIPSPMINLDGPIAFKGREPSQFDEMPYVFSRDRNEYVALPYHPEFTHLPWPDTGFRLAQVSSSGPIPGATGPSSLLVPQSGLATIFDFDGEKLVAGSNITIFNLSTDAVAPSSWVLLVLIQGYWYVVNSTGGRLAQVTGSNIAALTGTGPWTASSGSIVFCTFNSSTGVITAGTDSATVWNMGTLAVASGSLVQVKSALGAWWIDVVMC